VIGASGASRAGRFLVTSGCRSASEAKIGTEQKTPSFEIKNVHLIAARMSRAAGFPDSAISKRFQ